MLHNCDAEPYDGAHPNPVHLVYEHYEMEHSSNGASTTITKDEIHVIAQHPPPSSSTNGAIANDICASLDQMRLKKGKTRRKVRPKKPKPKPVEQPVPLEKSRSFTELTRCFRIVAGADDISGTVCHVRNRQNRSIRINTSECAHARPHTASPRRPAFVHAPPPKAKKGARAAPAAESNERTPSKGTKKKPLPPFPKYWPEELVRSGLIDGVLIKGVIRINSKNCKESYVNNENEALQDYLIPSIVDRNRALEGDVVALKIKPESEWRNEYKTATVVYILEKVHTRLAVGVLEAPKDAAKRFCMLTPRDRRIPRLQIPSISWPAQLFDANYHYDNTLFQAKVLEWKTPAFALGLVIRPIGTIGDLTGETHAIIAEHDLNIVPFTQHLLTFIPSEDELKIDELTGREDLRTACIFTVDPATARDLDDALSCRRLPNGNHEIGVHISDVSFYLKEATPLDAEVSKKATSIYLVDRVHHMLPEELCMRCSLLPGADKLAFSIFFEMDDEARVCSHRFARTLINSCAQLSYEHAQTIIDDGPGKLAALPHIYNGYEARDLESAIGTMHRLAVILRRRRFDNGSLRIDQPKLSFSLCAATGQPLDFSVYENKPAHRMIEEFMLVANMTAARKICMRYPELAFLRCHDPPKQMLLQDLRTTLLKYDVELDITSAKGLQRSILQYEEDEDPMTIARVAALSHLLTKPMTRARYFCTGTCKTEKQFKHFSLAVDMYTHFTSPIRRYADVIVHRLLSASLDDKICTWTTDYVAQIAANCNKQKYNAKRAGDTSSELYLAHYVESHQPFVKKAVVVDVKDSSFDILVMQTGSVIRMYLNNMGKGVEAKMEETDGMRKVMVKFPETDTFPQVISIVEMFSVLTVNLTRLEKTSRLEAKLLRPITSQIFYK